MEGNSKPSDILYIYKDVPVRKHNYVKLRVDEITFKEIIDLEVETGLSQRKILGYSASPCKCCENTSVNVFINDKEVKIKRGILSRRIPASFTNKKHKHINNRPVINTETKQIFESVKQILQFVDISYNPLLDRLNGRCINNTPFVFYDEYLKQNPDAKNNRSGQKD